MNIESKLDPQNQGYSSRAEVSSRKQTCYRRNALPAKGKTCHKTTAPRTGVGVGLVPR